MSPRVSYVLFSGKIDSLLQQSCIPETRSLTGFPQGIVGNQSIFRGDCRRPSFVWDVPPAFSSAPPLPAVSSSSHCLLSNPGREKQPVVLHPSLLLIYSGEVKIYLWWLDQRQCLAWQWWRVLSQPFNFRPFILFFCFLYRESDSLLLYDLRTRVFVNTLKP